MNLCFLILPDVSLSIAWQGYFYYISLTAILFCR